MSSPGTRNAATHAPTAETEGCNQNNTNEAPVPVQSDNTTNPTGGPATASEPRDQRPAEIQFGDTNSLVLAGHIITFHNVDLDDYTTFHNCLLECGYLAAGAVSVCRHNIWPIVDNIQYFANLARDKRDASESRFRPNWYEPDPEQHRLRRDAYEFHSLCQKLGYLFSFGLGQTDYLHALWLKVSQQARAAFSAGDRAPTIAREAWKCLLWFMWGFRVYCDSLIDDLLPILQDWDDWNWPDLQAKKEGLRLVAFLVRRRVEKLPTGIMLHAKQWRDMLVEEDRDAFNWLEDND